MRTPIVLLSLAALSFAVTGCDMDHRDHAGSADVDHHGHAAAAGMEQKHESMWASIHEAVAVIYPTKGNTVSGTITFTEVKSAATAPAHHMGGMVHIHGTITGLEPNSVHACHIHEFGDQTSADGMSTGSHYNPEGHKHGGPDAPEHHAGDFGNLTADATGKATIDLTVGDLSIAGLKNPVIGRAVVLHAKVDDFSQPVGNAGGRIGVGIIGIAKPQP